MAKSPVRDAAPTVCQPDPQARCDLHRMRCDRDAEVHRCRFTGSLRWHPSPRMRGQCVARGPKPSLTSLPAPARPLPTRPVSPSCRPCPARYAGCLVVCAVPCPVHNVQQRIGQIAPARGDVHRPHQHTGPPPRHVVQPKAKRRNIHIARYRVYLGRDHHDVLVTSDASRFHTGCKGRQTPPSETG